MRPVLQEPTGHTLKHWEAAPVLQWECVQWECVQWECVQWEAAPVCAHVLEVYAVGYAAVLTLAMQVP